MLESYFDCNGGDILAEIGASYLISYLYYININPEHLNYKKRSTQMISKIIKNQQYVRDWVNYVSELDQIKNRLASNTIGLMGYEVVDMTKKLKNLSYIRVE